jgi:threonine dehydrogenase-like Zn-dependent dehydrogenase
MTPGPILGHEAVGTVTDTGPGVGSVKQGDHVWLSCVSACGRCRYCRERQYGQRIRRAYALVQQPGGVAPLSGIVLPCRCSRPQTRC